MVGEDTSRIDQFPLSSEESPNISLNKTQDDKYNERVYKTKNVPIMDETMSQSSKSPCKPQEENYSFTNCRTKVFYAVEERNDLASMSKGSNDNSVNLTVVNVDAVGGMLDNSAHTSSQYNISSAEGTEPNSDNNYGHDANVSSSLENNTFIFGKMYNSSSLDTIFNSSHICSQPPTIVTIGDKPYEDTIEKQDPVKGSQTNDVGIVEDIYTGSLIAGSDDNSSNFALDDNNTVGSRLNESANASSSQILKNLTSVSDKIGNDFLLNTRPEDSSPFSSWPHANHTVVSGPYEDTLELKTPIVTGLESNPADNSSMLGTFGMDKTKGKKYSHESQDENNGPTISKADKEQNALFVSQNADLIENKYIATSSHEDDNPTNSGFIDYDAVNSKLDNCASAGSRGNPISAEDTELHKTTYEHDVGICSSQAENNISRASKTEEQNVLSTDHDTIVIEKKSAASSSQGSNGNSNNWTVPDNNYTVDNISSAEGKEVESGGNCEHGMDTSPSKMLKSCTSMIDKTDTGSSLNTRSKQPYPNVTVDSELCEDSLERQKPDVRGREFHATDKVSISLTSANDNIKNKNLFCEMMPIPLKTEQEEKELAETNDKNISYGSQDEQRRRGFKTKEEQHELNVRPDTTKMKQHIDYSNHASNEESENFSDALVNRLDNSTNEGRRANTSSPEDTDLDKKNNHGHEIKIQSSQELINPTSMHDKMESNCPLDTRPNKSSFFSNQSYASAIEDKDLHEDTIEEQKPVVRDSESLLEDKIFTDLEQPHGVSSDNESEDQFPINNTNIHTFLGNKVYSKKSSESQNTDDATRQSNLELKMKVRRQKSQKRVRNANFPDKSARVLQPKRGEKAFNKTNHEKRTPITYTPEDGARTFKANSYKEKEIITRMNQSIESIRPMGSEKLKGSWAAVVKWLVFLWLFHNFMLAVHATPILPLTEWQQHTFCIDGYPLTNQTLVISNMEQTTDPGCMFSAPAVPYFYNCSKFNALVFLNNATCLEMFTTDLQTQSWDLEYGTGYNGKHLKSVRGELFTHTQILAEVHQYEGGDGPQARGYLQSTTTPGLPSTNGTTSKLLDRSIWSRIFGTLAAILVILLVLVLLWCYFVKRCMNKSKTQSPTNDIKLHNMKKDGDDTNKGLLSNGTSEPQHKNQMAEI